MKKYILALILIIIGGALIVKGILQNFPVNYYNYTKNITLVKSNLNDNLKEINIIDTNAILRIKKSDHNSIEVNNYISYDYVDGKLNIRHIRKNNRKENYIYITYKDKVNLNIENFAGIINYDLTEGSHSFTNVAGTMQLFADTDINYNINNTLGIINNNVSLNPDSLIKLLINNFVGTADIIRKE
ncbi:hypothetical protein [Caviibacter abscessus]|uniref:hypothetical protein n=1 Tax=Caviibacter abscessus TaxID=1766719 RepID=UPI00082FEE33|nr:hypothetical protein [Caviibacter abscessus]